MAAEAASREMLARRHVTKGREIVERQRDLIARLRIRGHDCAEAERLLVRFQQTLAIFEADLAVLTCNND